jgi:adenylate cyclase
VLDLSERLLDMSNTLGLPVWHAGGRVLNGWAVAREGEPEAAMDHVREALARLTTLGVEVMRPYQLALAGEVAGMLGEPDDALDLVGAALDAVARGGERWCEAELVRLRSQFVLQSARANDSVGIAPDEVEKLLHDAIDIARHQQARSFELRAATSLARLHLDRGRPEPGRATLAEIYRSFSEGHGTADLRDAAALIGEP